MSLFENIVKKMRKSNDKHKLMGGQDLNGTPVSSQDALLPDLEHNLQGLRSIYANCADIVFRSFLIGGHTKAEIIYIIGLSDTELLDQNVLMPLMHEVDSEPDGLLLLVEQKISVSNVKKIQTLPECVGQLSIGNPLLLVEGIPYGIGLGLAKPEKRSIQEPNAESVVRGPREGFIEVLAINAALLRRKLPSPQLKMESLKVGRYTQTEVMIAYIQGIAGEVIVQEVKNRLQRIDIDGVLESAYLEEFIEDSPFSIFPQVMNTERPDVAAASLLEGRVVILMNGTPFVLIVPVTIYSLLQSPEDYYARFLFSTFIRWLRYGFLLIALLLPSIYVAILTFHQEMIPTSLYLSVAKSREEIPFPALVEAFIMETTFEALREAGVRLPKQVGSAVSIVGALVIGQAAVSAGIVSAPMVMVVAITGISSFMLPRYNVGIAIRLLRFPVMLLAGVLGLLGIILAVITVIVHLCTLRSFGVPYLSPLGPMKGKEIKDVLMRAPRWQMSARPDFSQGSPQYRQPPNMSPGSEKGPDEG